MTVAERRPTVAGPGAARRWAWRTFSSGVLTGSLVWHLAPTLPWIVLLDPGAAFLTWRFVAFLLATAGLVAIGVVAGGRVSAGRPGRGLLAFLAAVAASLAAWTADDLVGLVWRSYRLTGSVRPGSVSLWALLVASGGCAVLAFEAGGRLVAGRAAQPAWREMLLTVGLVSAVLLGLSAVTLSRAAGSPVLYDARLALGEAALAVCALAAVLRPARLAVPDGLVLVGAGLTATAGYAVATVVPGAVSGPTTLLLLAAALVGVVLGLLGARAGADRAVAA